MTYNAAEGVKTTQSVMVYFCSLEQLVLNTSRP